MAEVSIFLFRHGQSTFNKAQRFTGWKNPNLTSLGVKQAKIIANKLKKKQIGIAFETRLKRSKMTLKQVLKYHPECSKIYIDNRMIERNYGELNGTTHQDFIKKIGARLYKLEVEGDALTDLDKRAADKIKDFLGTEEYALIHRGYNIRPPAGESFADVEKRVKSFISHLKKIAKKEKVNIAISAHGNSIRLFRKIMEHASPDKAIKWKIPYDDYYEYKIKV